MVLRSGPLDATTVLPRPVMRLRSWEVEGQGQIKGLLVGKFHTLTNSIGYGLAPRLCCLRVIDNDPITQAPCPRARLTKRNTKNEQI